MPPAESKPKLYVLTAVPMTVEVFLLEQVRAMQAGGLDVTVVTSPTPEIDVLRERGIACRPVPIPRSISPRTLLRSMFSLVRLFRKQRPDLVHTHTPIAAFIGQLAAWMAGVPSRITTVHGLFFVNEPRKVWRFLYEQLEVIACRLATKVVCVSGEDRRYLIERHGFSESKITTFHVGVNLEQYSAGALDAAEREAVRREVDIPTGAVVFGIVARMVREKGFLELFEAFAKVAQRHDSVYLLHVGPVDDSRDDAVTPQEAERFGCLDRCRFVGMRRDVPRFLAAMDVFCLPTHREGYPGSLMEAAAMGLPSITTDIRGCREAVIHGETGLIVPARDPAALEAAMEQLVASPAMRERMGRNALERARSFFDRRHVVEKTMALYGQELSRIGRRIGDTPPAGSSTSH